MSIEVGDKQSSCIIQASNELEPLCQGSLDGLCGIYAIINAIRIAAYGYRRDTHSNNHALFVASLERLEKRGPITDFVTDGMSKSDFRALTKYLCKKASNSKIRLTYKALPVRAPHDERRRNILAALAADFPVLIELEHKYHFTLAVGFTPRTLTLFDSYDYTRTKLEADRTRRAIVVVGIPSEAPRRSV